MSVPQRMVIALFALGLAWSLYLVRPGTTDTPDPPPAPQFAGPAVAVPTAPAVSTATDTFPRTALVIPVLGIRPDQLRNTFMDARGANRRHDAIDIMAPAGTPVLAAAPATVVRLDNGARGGIALYALGHDRRTIYYYAHLQSYAAGITEGRRLMAGEVIGYVGDSGNAGAGNFHLHFEVTTTADPTRYWGGVPINPYPLLRNGITYR